MIAYLVGSCAAVLALSWGIDRLCGPEVTAKHDPWPPREDAGGE